MYLKKAFTFVELMIAVSISTIILFFVGGFIASSLGEIVDSNNEVNFFVNYEEFKMVFNDYKNILGNRLVVKDNTGTGSDVLFMYDDNKKLGVIFGVVDKTTMKLENNQNKYDTYYDKVLGYRELSEIEIGDIIADSSKVFTYSFFVDKLIHDIGVADFQVIIFNEGKIIDILITIYQNYQKHLDGTKIKNRGLQLKKYNLNF